MGGFGNQVDDDGPSSGQLPFNTDATGVAKLPEYGDDPYSPPSSSTPAANRQAKPKGISIKSKGGGKSNALLDQLTEAGEISVSDTSNATSTAAVSKAQPVQQAHKEAVHLAVEEAATILYDEDGNLNGVQVQGRIFLQISDPEQAKVKIRIAHQAGQGWQFNTHPNIKKDAFFGVSDPWLMLAKEDRAFPCGNALGVLKWKYQTNDESQSPLSVTCWPSNQSGKTHCNLEYNLGEVLSELEDVTIYVPLPGSAVHPPEIIDCDGETTFDSKNSQLVWTVSTMDASNSSGALEFAVPQADDHQDFFPVQVSFTSPATICAMQVLQVVAPDGQTPVRFSSQTSFKVDSYKVGGS